MIYDGKARTAKQWQALKKKQEESKIEKGIPVDEEVRYGRCEKCNNGSFTHKIVERRFIRVCKNPNCLDEIEV